jgi:uncharacterized protein YajQ (UPF0234 family)
LSARSTPEFVSTANEMKRRFSFEGIGVSTVRQSRPECSVTATDEEGFEQEDSMTEVALKREIKQRLFWLAPAHQKKADGTDCR